MVLSSIYLPQIRKDLWEFKRSCNYMPPATGCKGVTDIKWKELLFHPNLWRVHISVWCHWAVVLNMSKAFDWVWHAGYLAWFCHFLVIDSFVLFWTFFFFFCESILLMPVFLKISLLVLALSYINDLHDDGISGHNAEWQSMCAVWIK